MKITAVIPVHVAIPYEHGAPKPVRHGVGAWTTQDILLVRVETDAGITGWGEAFAHASTPVTKVAISEIVGPLAIGRDPSDIHGLMGDLTRRTQSIGGGGPVAFALSGLDIALWDIAGKVAGQPLHGLLGGTAAARVPAYASLFRMPSPEHVANACRRASDRGYRHIKLHEHTVEAVAAAREAIGGDASLMVDVNCYWHDVDDVVAFCRAVERYNLSWLEEPLYPADRYDMLAVLKSRVGIPLAVGENLGNVNDLRWLGHAADIVQPSLPKIGGVSGAWQAVQYLRAEGIRTILHSPFTGPALIATLQMISAMGEPGLCEHRFCDLEASPTGNCVLASNGMLETPQGPGLGFQIDEKILERYAVD